MFPRVAAVYYAKRAQHVKEAEERRLRDLITAAIPTGTDGWHDDFGLPRVIIRQPPPHEAQPQPACVQHGEPTPPPSPTSKPTDLTDSPSAPPPSFSHPQSTPVHIEALARLPPHPCKPSPPPQTMSSAARLACLARWTAFSSTGTPYLVSSPHAKDVGLQWGNAVEAGFDEEGLVRWAREMWWVVWVRQCVVNWRGMWAKRFDREEAKIEKARKEGEERAEREKMEEEVMVKAEELVKKQRGKILGRLEGLNRALGLVKAEE